MLSLWSNRGTSMWRYLQQAGGSRSTKPEGEVSVEIQMESQQQMLVAVDASGSQCPGEMCREQW